MENKTYAAAQPKKQDILSTWIKRGVPKNFDYILDEAGIDPKIWENIKESGEDVEVTALENIGASDTAKLNTSIIGMADIVLHSNTIYGEALKKNIEAFYSAVLEKKKVGKEPSGSSPDIPPDAAGNVG